MLLIPLRNRRSEIVAVALVDDCDRHLTKLRWHLCGEYARHTYSATSRIYLHHAIMPCEDGLEVDHKNGDKLDNRRKNLRRVTKLQQRQNLPSYQTQGRTSQFRGVSWDSVRQKWRAKVKKDGKTVFFARFDSEVDAAAAAREHRLRVFSHSVDN
jgi:hypothetical protein